MMLKLVLIVIVMIIDFGVVESGIRECEIYDVLCGLVFVKLVIEIVFCVVIYEVDEYIVDGGVDRGIDIVYIDYNNKVINIGSCKIVIDFKNLKKFFLVDEIDKIILFVDDVFLRRDEIVDKCNGKFLVKIREIWEIFDMEVYIVFVYLFLNCLIFMKDVKECLFFVFGWYGVSFFEYGLYEFFYGIVKLIKLCFKKLLCVIDSKVYINNNEYVCLIVLIMSFVDIVVFFSIEIGLFDE